MAWLDGAVNGMVSRLVPAGFTPDEAVCLAQAAYIKERKRADGVPRTVLERQQVSYEINQTLKRLGPFPMGTEAHRQRIILWEKVFGRGSWPEPIDPEEIYGLGANQSPGGIVDALMLQKNADDAAFFKLSHTGPPESGLASNLDKVRRGFQALAGGHSLFCTFETRGSADLQKGLIACAQEKIGLFTMQSLAKSGDPLPGDRIVDFSSIRNVGYTIVPSELDVAELAHFTGFELPRMALRIIVDNDDVWDIGQMGGYGSTAYVNFVKGFHDDYQKWHTDRFPDRPPTGRAAKEPAAAAPMIASRTNHTATLLPGGTVLVAGGKGGSSVNSRRVLRPDGDFDIAPDKTRGPCDSSELFDPTTGTWQKTANMTTARSHHTATLLPNGTVLVAGGETNDWVHLASAELYDPATGKWSTTASMEVERANHCATLLPNGTVLVTGGRSEDRDSLASAELYDPATGTWSTTANMEVARYDHSATLLPNGTVLVCGGDFADFHSLEWVEVYHPVSGAWLGNIEFPEIYAPVAGTWLLKAGMAVARSGHCATLLPNGTVLVTGGFTGGFPNSSAVAGVELYDPGAGTWSTTESMEVARYDHSATLMPDGTVLIVGGRNLASGDSVDSAELFDPETRKWSPQTGTGSVLYDHTATLLTNGAVLITGGTVGEDYYDRESVASAVLYR